MEEVELAEAFTVLEYAKNLTDAVLWWKAMLRKGNPEGAMVILSIHDAVPGYICEEDVEMSKEVLTMHKDIDIDESEEIFDYTDSNGNQKTGQAIFCYTDTKTNEKYLLFRQDIHSEQISISVSKFRRDEKEIILLPIVTQRDIVMEQIIRDIAIYILT